MARVAPEKTLLAMSCHALIQRKPLARKGTMHYYQFNIGDYIKQTIHLTVMEDLTYRRLLDLYYDTEKPIPNDIPWVSRRIRMDIENVKTILNEFFELTDEGYRNRRADREITDFRSFLDKQRANGSKGGRPKKPTAIPTLTQTEPKKTLNNNHKPITNKQKINTPDGVPVSLWSDFLVLRKAKNLPMTETALNGIKREADKANLTMVQAITICCERGWGGFKADWLKEPVAKESQAWRTDDVAMLQKAKELGVSTTGKSRFEIIAAIDKKRGAV